MNEKYNDSVRDVDIENICRNSDFGALHFSRVIEVLKTMVADIIELEDLDFRAHLTQSEIEQIGRAREEVGDFISQIKNFSITQPDSTQKRDEIVQRIENFYNRTFAGLVRSPLNYLRDKVRTLAKNDETEYRKLAKELKTLVEEVKEEKAKLEKDKISVEQGRGVVSAEYLSKKFKEQAEKAEKEANVLQGIFMLIALGMFASIILSGYYFFLKIKDLVQSQRIEYLVFSATFLATIFFLLRVVLRNYNIAKHIETSNDHRANVASTLEGFLVQTNYDQDLKTALLKEGSVALFQTESTGYLSKDQIEISTPIKEVMNTVVQKV